MCNKPTTLVRSAHAALQSKPLKRCRHFGNLPKPTLNIQFMTSKYLQNMIFRYGRFSSWGRLQYRYSWPFVIIGAHPDCHLYLHLICLCFQASLLFPTSFISTICAVVIDYQLSLWLFVIIGALSSFSLIIDRLLHPQQSLPSVSNISSPGSSSKYPLNLNVSRV